MKRLSLLLISFLSLSILVLAQVKMHVYKDDGSILELLAERVDSIAFLFPSTDETDPDVPVGPGEPDYPDTPVVPPVDEEEIGYIPEVETPGNDETTFLFQIANAKCDDFELYLMGVNGIWDDVREMRFERVEGTTSWFQITVPAMDESQSNFKIRANGDWTYEPKMGYELLGDAYKYVAEGADGGFINNLMMRQYAGGKVIALRVIEFVSPCTSSNTPAGPGEPDYPDTPVVPPVEEEEIEEKPEVSNPSMDETTFLFQIEDAECDDFELYLMGVDGIWDDVPEMRFERVEGTTSWFQITVPAMDESQSNFKIRANGDWIYEPKEGYTLLGDADQYVAGGADGGNPNNIMMLQNAGGKVIALKVNYFVTPCVEEADYTVILKTNYCGEEGTDVAIIGSIPESYWSIVFPMEKIDDTTYQYIIEGGMPGMEFKFQSTEGVWVNQPIEWIVDEYNPEGAWTYGIENFRLTEDTYIVIDLLDETKYAWSACVEDEETDTPTIIHNITFKANGGYGTMYSEEIESNANYNIPSCSFSRTGYRFIGWNTEADGSGVSYYAYDNVIIASDLVLYAQWEEQIQGVENRKLYFIDTENLSEVGAYVWIYDTYNDYIGWPGEYANKENFMKDGLNVYSYDMSDKEEYDMIIFNDYMSFGWQTDDLHIDYSKPYYCNGDWYESLDDITLYTISFNANGGEGTMNTKYVNSQVPNYIPYNTFVKEGYVFIGWNTRSNGSGVFYESNESITLTSNITLYAQWEQLKESNGTGIVYGHEYVDLGLPSGLLWATCNVGANSPEGYGDYFAWGETQPKDYYDWEDYKWMTYDMYSWTGINKYTFADVQTSGVWYNSNGEFIGDNKTSLDIIDDAANANWGGNWRMPTKEEQDELLTECNFGWTIKNGVYGYVVTGPNGNTIFLPAAGDLYYSDPEGYSSKGNYWSSSLGTYYSDYACYLYFDSYGVHRDEISRSRGRSVRPVISKQTENPVSYIVSFDANGGSGSMSDVSKDANTIYSVPSNTFTRSGYEFICWNTKADGTGVNYKVGAGLTITSDITLYAQWSDAFQYTGLSNGYAYVDLGLPSGTKWATMNVGATSPEGYGNYYAWGETQTKNYYSDDTYKWYSDGEFTKYPIVKRNAQIPEASVEQRSASSGVYLRGNGDWNTLDREFIYVGDGVYVYDEPITLKSAFKIADADWMDINYGSDYYAEIGIIPVDYYGSDIAVSNIIYATEIILDIYNETLTIYGSYGGSVSYDYWTICGVEELMGESWLPSSTQNRMTKYGSVYELEISNVYLTTDYTTEDDRGNIFSGYGYKVVANGEWGIKEYPTVGNNYIEVDVNGYYDIIFTFDYYNETLTAEAVLIRAVDEETTVELYELELEDDVASVYWGGNWRMPTEVQQDELLSYCTWTWYTLNGVNGYKVTSNINGKSIFLPAAGYMDSSSRYSVGSSAYYWSNTLATSTGNKVYVLSLSSDGADIGNDSRYYGQSVRPVLK